MPKKGDAPIQCGLEFALVDEIDSVLIDDGKMPLILANVASAQATDKEYAEAGVALGLADMLEKNTHFEFDLATASVSITPAGEEKLIDLAGKIKGPWLLARFRNEKIRQALHVMHVLKADVDYIVRKDSLELIDQSTGRAMPDRQLPHGMHQMLQAYAGCSLTAEARVQLSITFRGLFSRYRHLCGMTGTLKGLERELNADYNAQCEIIAPHHPNLICQKETLIFRTQSEQTQWVINDVRQRVHRNQPVMLGVRTVEECDVISTVLSAHDIDHNVISAANDEQEAQIVAKAGVGGTVTVATNMAGRGTDIPVDNDAREAGGLHVISLSVNESFRLDRQLFGRAARQGQPGSCQCVLSMQDPLLKKNISRVVRKIYSSSYRIHPDLGNFIGVRLVKSAVRRIERRHEAERRHTWWYSQDMERKLAYGIQQTTEMF